MPITECTLPAIARSRASRCVIVTGRYAAMAAISLSARTG